MITSLPGDNEDYVAQRVHLKWPTIFLAGPSLRGEYNGKQHWRLEAIKLIGQMGFTGIVFSPEPMTEEYAKQVAWEDRRLHEAEVIAFWVPRDLETLPGFTTNIEFGEWMKSGKCVLGYPEGAPKTRYLRIKADKYGIPVAHTLFDTMDLAVRKARAIQKSW